MSPKEDVAKITVNGRKHAVPQHYIDRARVNFIKGHGMAKTAEELALAHMMAENPATRTLAWYTKYRKIFEC